MESHGVQAECRVAFSRIEKWRASGEEVNLFHHRRGELAEKHQTADAEVMMIRIWMVKDQMGTDTSQTD